MSTPFLKSVTLTPPPVPAGTDVRLLRPFLEQLRATVAQCVQAINSASVPYSPRVASGGSGGDTPAEDPAYYKTLRSASEGSEAADTTTWTVGDVDGLNNALGLRHYEVTHVSYFHTGGSLTLWAYTRLKIYTTDGRLYYMGPETRWAIDVPTITT